MLPSESYLYAQALFIHYILFRYIRWVVEGGDGGSPSMQGFRRAAVVKLMNEASLWFEVVSEC